MLRSFSLPEAVLLVVPVPLLLPVLLPVFLFSGKPQGIDEPVPVMIIELIYFIQPLHMDGKLLFFHNYTSCPHQRTHIFNKKNASFAFFRVKYRIS